MDVLCFYVWTFSRNLLCSTIDRWNINVLWTNIITILVSLLLFFYTELFSISMSRCLLIDFCAHDCGLVSCSMNYPTSKLIYPDVKVECCVIVCIVHVLRDITSMSCYVNVVTINDNTDCVIVLMNSMWNISCKQWIALNVCICYIALFIVNSYSLNTSCFCF